MIVANVAICNDAFGITFLTSKKYTFNLSFWDRIVDAGQILFVCLRAWPIRVKGCISIYNPRICVQIKRKDVWLQHNPRFRDKVA